MTPAGRVSEGESPRAPLGILLLDGKMARVPGCLATPASFPYPVVHQVVPGANAPAGPEEARALLPRYREAARRLEQRGVAAITDNCNGNFAHVQGELAAAVSVPVVTSALLAVPLLHRLLPRRRIGILTFFEEAVDERLCRACGFSSDEVPIAVGGVGESAAWLELLRTKEAPGDLPARLDADLVAAARGLLERHPDIGAWVLECTLLPPAAEAVRRATGRPVHDVLTLVDWAIAGSRRPAAARVATIVAETSATSAIA